LPSFRASDAFTVVLVRREKFAKAENISDAVCNALTAAIAERFPSASAELEKAWTTTVRRMAVVKLTSRGSTVCVASLHCSKSEGTAELLGALKDVLEDAVGPFANVIVGLDSNVPGNEAREFQSKLLEMGMEFGGSQEAQQVTVAKMRTMFQTQVKKAGEMDVSHKDYVLTWGAAQRQATAYTPDLCTAFGIDRNENTMRLPTTCWPFDHAAVTAKVSVGTYSSAMAIYGPCLGACRGACQYMESRLRQLLVMCGIVVSLASLLTGGLFPQLVVTLYLCIRARPISCSSPLTERYFTVAILNNILYLGGPILHYFMIGETSNPFAHGTLAPLMIGETSNPFTHGTLAPLMFCFGGLPGSVVTIAITHLIVTTRLEAMGRGRGLRAMFYCEVAGLGMLLLCVLGYAINQAAWLVDQKHVRPVVHSAMVNVLCWLSACSIVISYLSCKEFICSIWDIVKEAEEGGEVESKARVLYSQRAQLKTTFLAMATSTAFWGFWLLLFAALSGTSWFHPLNHHIVGLVLSILFDSICNDICVHYLAFAVDDSALNTAKRIRRERVLRAAKELRTHDIACRVLHAGPTSLARCAELRVREEAARRAVGTSAAAMAFKSLQALVDAERSRIHRLYFCILLRCMVMPVRFGYLRDVRSFTVTPDRVCGRCSAVVHSKPIASAKGKDGLDTVRRALRRDDDDEVVLLCSKCGARAPPAQPLQQPVPDMFRESGAGAEDQYFAWLFRQIEEIRMPFLEQMASAVEKLNKAVKPSDLGLLPEEFHFKIWRGAGRSVMSTDERLYPGEVVAHSNVVNGRASTSLLSFVTSVERESTSVEVQPFGSGDRLEVVRDDVRAHNRGAGVFIPGPLKLVQRCRDKIAADYGGQAPWPPASSLFDIVRCAIAFEDPYAMAVMVAFLKREFDVVRVKNRFESDQAEEVSPERTLAEFYAAETLCMGSDSTKSDKMYRDVLINLRPKGSKFICEVQLTLTGISILKKSEQKIYTLARMASAEELTDTFVFSKDREVDLVIAATDAGKEEDLERVNSKEFIEFLGCLGEADVLSPSPHMAISV
jgi:hypothetical protein